MRKWTIFGRSDDLVQFAEDGKTFEELGAYGGAMIGFDDGTVLRADYGERTGLWRFAPLHVGEGSTLQRVYDPPLDNEDDYSERWELTGEITSFFQLPDWKLGCLVPSPGAIRAALADASRVRLARTRNEDLELAIDGQYLVLDAKALTRLLIRTIGTPAQIVCELR